MDREFVTRRINILRAMKPCFAGMNISYSFPCNIFAFRVIPYKYCNAKRLSVLFLFYRLSLFPSQGSGNPGNALLSFYPLIESITFLPGFYQIEELNLSVYYLEL